MLLPVVDIMFCYWELGKIVTEIFWSKKSDLMNMVSFCRVALGGNGLGCLNDASSWQVSWGASFMVLGLISNLSWFELFRVCWRHKAQLFELGATYYFDRRWKGVLEGDCLSVLGVCHHSVEYELLWICLDCFARATGRERGSPPLIFRLMLVHPDS